MSELAMAKPPVWRTVVRPKEASAAYYKDFFDQQGIFYGVNAERILDETDFTLGPDSIDLVRLTVGLAFTPGPNMAGFTGPSFGGENLGFKKGARLAALFEKASSAEFGLAKLPLWAPVQLRYEYADQPEEECLIAAMDPVTSVKHFPSLWSLEHRTDSALPPLDAPPPKISRRYPSRLWLNAEWAFPETWKPHYEFLFGIAKP